MTDLERQEYARLERIDRRASLAIFDGAQERHHDYHLDLIHLGHVADLLEVL